MVMAKKVDGWLSTTGKVFETEHAAVCDELRVMIADSDTMNDASAQHFAAWLINSGKATDFCEAVRRAVDTHPSMPVAAGPPTPMPYTYREPDDGHDHFYLPRKGEQLQRCQYCNQQEPFPIAAPLSAPELTPVSTDWGAR